MTAIVTWNIQDGKGCDGKSDLARIARVAKALGEADVYCFQEISRNDPAISGGMDEFLVLESLFPGYKGIFGTALDRDGRQYGNLILTRLPLLQSFNHLLPQPAEDGIKHMQRQAIEAVIRAKGGPLRVATTHLEYWSARHRAAQIERLRSIQEEAAANERSPAIAAPSPYDAVPRPASLVLCGDFNCLPGEAEYALLFRPPLFDAWTKLYKSKPHPPSTGLYDKVQWTSGPHCRDYFAVTQDVAARLVSLEMDECTNASDHQPLRLVIADP